MKSFYLGPCTRKPKKCAQVPRALNIELTINSLVVIRFPLVCLNRIQNFIVVQYASQSLGRNPLADYSCYHQETRALRNSKPAEHYKGEK